ncbi:MAG: benzoate/H(+) symporter BenE family transporter [Dehalococcoidia bacterium]|jgi:benzoate membrane transport protein|nr:benzoate/H(+) symporter BenE family transporter [Dehalococcoidia bacterium]
MSIATPAMPAKPGTFRVKGINHKVTFAGVTILMTYLFAGLPVQVGVLAQLDLTTAESSRWFFITWMTTGVFSFGLALFTRQPVSVNLSIPVMIFLAGAAGGFSLPQILGANLVVGMVAIGLSALKLTEVFSRLVPPQIALAVFAGSILAFMVKTTGLAVTDIAVSGPVIGGYLLGLTATRSQLVGVAVAAAVGFVSAVLAGGAPEIGNSVAMPEMGFSAIEFSPVAIIALGIPILVLTVGVANIQALALLRSEGYRVKADCYGLAAGATTVMNALGGGQAAALGGTAMAVASDSSAGPAGYRFWAIVLSSLPVVMVALIAVPVIAIVQDLPLSFTLSIGALALLPTFRVVARKSVTGRVRGGAVTALVVAALPFQAFGMPMAFWALLAGAVVSVAMEHRTGFKTRRPGGAAIEQSGQSGTVRPPA